MLTRTEFVSFLGGSMIINIDGTDGCGKKTQTELLYNYLTEKGFKCKLISFPNYESQSSSLVKMFLGGEFEEFGGVNAYQASVFYAVDRVATMKKVKVEDYDYIILDRYVASNMIHQSARVQDKSKVDEFLMWVDNLEFNELALPRPDKTLFLDMPVEVSLQLARARAELKNGQTRDIFEEDSEHMRQAYNNAKYVAKKFNWEIIDCYDKKLKSIEEIHKEILTKLGV